MNSTDNNIFPIVPDNVKFSNCYFVVKDMTNLRKLSTCNWLRINYHKLKMSVEGHSGGFRCESAKPSSLLQTDIRPLIEKTWGNKCSSDFKNSNYKFAEYHFNNLYLIQFIGSPPVQCACQTDNKKKLRALEVVRNSKSEQIRKIYLDNMELFPTPRSVGVLKRKVAAECSSRGKCPRTSNQADEMRFIDSMVDQGFVQHSFKRVSKKYSDLADQEVLDDLPAYILYDKSTLYDMVSLAINRKGIHRKVIFVWTKLLTCLVIS